MPTLILSGAQDLRTPTTNARTVAAQIPDAQLLIVPFTGHSVLGADFSGCAEQARGNLLRRRTLAAVPVDKEHLQPHAVDPDKARLRALAAGLRRRAGRTLTAVLDTIVDLNRQVIGATLQADRELPSGSSFGGLHGGYAKIGTSTVTLRKLVLIPGVQLSGTIPVKDGALQTATIRITGPAPPPAQSPSAPPPSRSRARWRKALRPEPRHGPALASLLRQRRNGRRARRFPLAGLVEAHPHIR